MKAIVLSSFLVIGSCVFAQEKVSNARNATPQAVTESQPEMPVSDSVTVHSTSRTGTPKTILNPEAAPVETAQPQTISPARKPE